MQSKISQSHKKTNHIKFYFYLVPRAVIFMETEIRSVTAYDPAIALLGIYPKDTDVVKRRAIGTLMFIAALHTIAKSWKEPRCPSTDDWIKKMWSI